MLVFDFDAWPQKVQAFQKHGFPDWLITPDPAYGALDELSKSGLNLVRPSSRKINYDSTDLFRRLLPFLIFWWFVHFPTVPSLKDNSRPCASFEFFSLESFFQLSTRFRAEIKAATAAEMGSLESLHAAFWARDLRFLRLR